MTYRTAENMIREIMAKAYIKEDVGQASHMNPANKSSDEDRVNAALKVLHDNGCPSAKAKDGGIEVDAMDANRAADVLDHAIAKNVIEVRPTLRSAEAIPVPEPHNPALSQDVVVPEPVATPVAAHEEKTEEPEQIDELSMETLHKVANVARKSGRKSVLDAAIKAGKRKRGQPDYKFAGEAKEFDASEQQLDEVSPSLLNSYSKAAKNSIKLTSLDKKINKRVEGIGRAKAKISKAVSKAMFGEEAATNMILRVRSLTEASGLRLKATVNSDCGKHCAKIYKDHEWNEHTVKFHINGKHHEPADYHTSDYQDAHDTAHAELKRITKLNGALKESTEEELQKFIEEEFEQIDELSKAVLGNYIKSASKDVDNQARLQGIMNSVAKTSPLTGISKDPRAASSAAKHLKAKNNRLSGISKAVDRLAKD